MYQPPRPERQAPKAKGRLWAALLRILRWGRGEAASMARGRGNALSLCRRNAIAAAVSGTAAFSSLGEGRILFGLDREERVEISTPTVKISIRQKSNVKQALQSRFACGRRRGKGS
jgi:hypothetical protein